MTPVRRCQGPSPRTVHGEAGKTNRTIHEGKAGPEVTTEVQSDRGAADAADEQPDEQDHMPSSQITELLADMEPAADAPQDPPLDAKSAALTEEREGSADDDR
jgi:hypothetical protein